MESVLNDNDYSVFSNITSHDCGSWRGTECLSAESVLRDINSLAK